MFKSNWFVDFDADKQNFRLHEIGASETGGARLEGIFPTFDEVLAKVPDAPLEAPARPREHEKPTDALPAPPPITQPRATTLLDEGVERLDLSPGLSGKLRAHGIHSIGDLVLASPGDLLNMRSFGPGKLQAVEAALAGLGLTLRRPLADAGD